MLLRLFKARRKTDCKCTYQKAEFYYTVFSLPNTQILLICLLPAKTRFLVFRNIGYIWRYPSHKLSLFPSSHETSEPSEKIRGEK